MSAWDSTIARPPITGKASATIRVGLPKIAGHGMAKSVGTGKSLAMLSLLMQLMAPTIANWKSMQISEQRLSKQTIGSTISHRKRSWEHGATTLSPEAKRICSGRKNWESNWYFAKQNRVHCSLGIFTWIKCQWWRIANGSAKIDLSNLDSGSLSKS